MRSMDSPRERSLDARGEAARAGPPRDLDGGPRRPAELLDQLRERLDRLPGNHPSARRESAERREPGSAEEEIRPADADEQAGAKEPADASEPAGEAKGLELDGAGYPGHEVVGPSGQLDPGWLEPGLPGGAADQYRPWFMSPDPGAPWFAEPGEAG
jgi:hypothetical protein